MTEERKLITEEEWFWSASRYAWNDLEPAPPKNWKPKCWGNLPYCGIPIKPVPIAVVFESCRNCPYRKSEGQK